MKTSKENGFRKEMHIRPAFDKRHPNPSRSYGIHGVEIHFTLIGEKGAVNFTIYTNWHLPKVQEELDKKSLDDRETYSLEKHKVVHLSCHPTGADVGYHSTTPSYEGQYKSSICPYLGGKKCYYDGSALYAEEVLKILIEKGEDGMWKDLMKCYKSYFEKDQRGSK